MGAHSRQAGVVQDPCDRGARALSRPDRPHTLDTAGSGADDEPEDVYKRQMHDNPLHLSCTVKRRKKRVRSYGELPLE